MQLLMSFYGGQLKQQIYYSFTMLISYMVLNAFKWWSNSFRLYQVFPILMVQMLFPQIQQVPDFRKIGKSLALNCCGGQWTIEVAFQKRIFIND